MAKDTNDEVLAVIPARAGSVKVPSKNIRLVAGKEVIKYTIDHARNSRTVTRVVVSTESGQIADIVSEYDCEVIMRPPELATDTARIDHALRHVIDTLAERESYRPDVVVLLYANVPVRDPSITDRCVEHLLTRGGTSVRTFVDVGKFHPLWMSRIEGDRETPYGELEVYRRQDLPKLYVHDGACVAVRAEVLDESRSRPDDNFAFMGGDRRAIVQESRATVEIDTPFDLIVAEAIIERKKTRENTGGQAAGTT